MDAPALRPRPRTPTCDRLHALRLLEHERLLAIALAVRAIASAWDRGLLAEPIAGALPHEGEVVGIYAAQGGLATDRLQQAERGVGEAMQALRDLEAGVVGRRPLADLIAEFGLSPLARLILMVVAAPQISDEAATLYKIVADETGRALVDEGLVVRLLGPRVNPHDIARELDPDRPLVRYGLVQVAPAPVRRFAQLTVEPLVISRLRGEALDEDPEGQLPVIGAARPLEDLRIEPAAIAALTAAVGRARPDDAPLRLVVRGRIGSGRRTVLAALAAAAGRRLALVHVLNVTDSGRPGSAAVRRALERCLLAGWVPCLDGLDLIAPDDRHVIQALRHVVSRYPGPVLGWRCCAARWRSRCMRRRPG